MKRLTTALLALIAAAGVAHAGSSKDEITRKAQQHAAALAAQPAVNLQQLMGGQLQPFAVASPNAICDVGTPDLVVHDDGSGENGYGWNPSANVGRIADKFTPAVYPAKIGTVCAAFITNAGVTSFNGTIAIYADDGTGGAPGTLLGSQAIVGHPVSISGLPFTPTFEAFDLSALPITIASGSVYISTEWDAALQPAGIFLGSDESTGTPLNGGYMHANTDPWAPIVDSNADYRAMMLRATMPIAGPGAPSVSKTFAPAQILAGGTSTLTITLNNASQPTAAVLDADLVDTFPAGLVVAATPNASTTCTSGTVNASAGGSTVTLLSGAEIPASGACTISVDVTAAADGSYVNTIAAGALSTQHGDNVNAASATLKVGFTFPEPYCPVTFPSAIEPITRVVFSNIDNTSPATDTVALQDFTAIVGNVAPGQAVEIKVEGNTAGSFTTPVAAFIDWNQDGVFDTVTEHYTIGSLVNSTGTDGQQVTTIINVPTGALAGTTRMRVIKKWSTEAPPCNNAGYGQAEDYTLAVGAASTAPELAKAFAPTQVLADTPSTLTITLDNADQAGAATLSGDLVDTFPAGLVVATTPNASTTCGGGTVTATAGAGSVTLGSGATIPGSGSCTVTVDVQSSVNGSYLNTLPAGALTTDLGDSPFAASATLKVGFTFPEPYCPVTFPLAIEPITHVVYAGIDNTSPATDTVALQDFTAIVGNVVPGQSLDMTVEGNTAGNYQTPVVAFVDWNQNGVFEPATEKYTIGTLNNSTGVDGQQVTAAIAVPPGALAGTTRLRVLKKYSTEADPCNSAGYGQGEDYTLLVGAPTPSLAKTFTPSTVPVNTNSLATITLTNPTATNAVLTAPLVDNFPAGLTISNASTSCGLIIGMARPIVTAASVTLPAGVAIPAGGSCQITANVQAAAEGSYVNTLAAGALQTDQGNNAMPASATLTVTAVAADPIAQVTPAALDFTVDVGSTGNDSLVIANIGAGTLTWSIDESATFNPNPPSYKTAAAALLSKAWTNAKSAGANSLSSGRSLGQGRFGAFVPLAPTDISQMADNSPGDEGVSCGQSSTSTADNSWWRRFAFSEYPAVSGWSSVAINSVTVSTGSSEIAGGLASTINLYTTPHTVAVDTIDTAQLTLIGTANFSAAGSLASIVVPVTGTVDDLAGKDLVVEWHTDGNTSGGQFYPGANATAETHPTFISSTACSLAIPTTAAAINFPDFHLTMVVNVDEGGGTPTGCANPSSIPWLSASPTSGSVAGGASSNVAVTVDATGMSPGNYSANLCVTTNDPAHALVTVPVTLEVTAPPPAFCNGGADEVFCDGFDPAGGGGDIYESGPINHAVANNLDGTSVNWITGDIQDADVPNYHFNPYNNSVQLTFWWNTGAPSIAGVSSSATTSDFLVLSSGAVVGPASIWSTTNNPGPAAWAAGATGYLGFRFDCSTIPAPPASGICYGYVHLQTTAPAGFPATILDYAYDKAGNAITIP